MDARGAVYEQVQRLVDVNSALYAAADATSASAEMRERVETWHAQALLWMQLADGIADGTNPRTAEWRKLGEQLAQTATELGAAMRDATVAGRVKSFLAGMPGALAYVTGRTAAAAGDAILALLGALPAPLLLVGAAGAVVLAWHVYRTTAGR